MVDFDTELVIVPHIFRSGRPVRSIEHRTRDIRSRPGIQANDVLRTGLIRLSGIMPFGNGWQVAPVGGSGQVSGSTILIPRDTISLKSPPSIAGSRNVTTGGQAFPLDQPLIGAEPERFVLDNRAARGSAVLMPPVFRLCRSRCDC